ncbi:MAG: hypothetical protein Satyrvirus39_5 [Satyrvirus sp.]|uniref:Uncharacterized protein n=1 Tax=Satyrvirus sp. TaxID=2487771 RepID=A0A3G5AF24_9VIRU|nr:MAG: hypothetical protein Satyrvirus39_5 [Satyrvirus sp.]
MHNKISSIHSPKFFDGSVKLKIISEPNINFVSVVIILIFSALVDTNIFSGK